MSSAGGSGNAAAEGEGGSGNSGSSTSADRSYKGSMSEYCKGLESWLWNSYWHRECAVSAYYSALSILYQQSPSLNAQAGAAGGVNANGNLFDNQGNFNLQNGAANQQQQRPTLVRQILIRGIRVNGNPLGIGKPVTSFMV